MVEFEDILNTLKAHFHLVKMIILVIATILLFNFILSIIEKRLLKRAKTKKHISDIEIFSRAIKYIFTFFVVIFAVFYSVGSWTGFGVTIGLISAAIGWALQKPITGIAAWIMIILKRPFEIGDRVIIGAVKGDVLDITLTHVYVAEVGGLFAGEEKSGRIILIPNAILFDQNIINYTSKEDYMLDQVAIQITYESDLDKAINTIIESTKKVTKEFILTTKKEPYVRTYARQSGVEINVRYRSPVMRLQEVSSDVTREILHRIKKLDGVEIAYPHSDVILRK